MYRDEKENRRLHINCLFDDGGLGDNICRLTSVKWLFDNQPHLIIHLWVPDYYVDFAKFALKSYSKRLVVRGFSQQRKFNDKFWGVRTIADRHSSLSTHLIDYNYTMIADYQPEDKDRNYIKLNFKKINTHKFNLPEKYIVLTPSFTAPARALLPEVANEIIDYIIKIGYTPVFLGKAESKVDPKRTLKGEEIEGIEYEKGLDLRDKTTLLEAAKVMSRAAVVVGLDNGLLHLAACSEVPIVMAFTNVEPRHRMPYRHDKLGWNVYPIVPDEDVKCRFCQSQFKFAFDQNFAFCYYEDYKCIQNLTADKYIEKIDEVLKNSV
jgi:ADP-heptose:LPS heptosyltransferase